MVSKVYMLLHFFTFVVLFKKGLHHFVFTLHICMYYVQIAEHHAHLFTTRGNLA